VPTFHNASQPSGCGSDTVVYFFERVDEECEGFDVEHFDFCGVKGRQKHFASAMITNEGKTCLEKKEKIQKKTKYLLAD
jgi:hypothetical protein